MQQIAHNPKGKKILLVGPIGKEKGAQGFRLKKLLATA